MKKLLIATAALAMVAGTAQAQSSVQVYGLMDLGYADSKNVTNDGTSDTTVRQKNTGNGHGGLATSRLGFRGTEDLGGGLKANFVLEYALGDAGIGGNGGATASKTLADAGADTASTNGFGARYSWVGLEDAKLGQLRLGRQEQSIHSIVTGGSAGGANNVAGAIYSGGINGNPNDAGIRPHTNVFVNRAVTYISPRINGFTAELQMAQQDVESGTTKTYNKTSGGSLKYAAGKFSAGYGFATSNIDTTEGAATTAITGTNTTTFTAASTTALDVKNQSQAVNAVYNFGVVRAFALYTEKKVTNSVSGALTSDTKATELGLQMPTGKTVLFASAFDGSRKGNTQTALATANADVSGYQVGAIYNLSKRTAAYAIYGNQEIKATANTRKVETTNVAAGIRHSF